MQRLARDQLEFRHGTAEPDFVVPRKNGATLRGNALMFEIRTFTFILNPITTSLPLPCELKPGHEFRRATEEEGERICEFLFTGGFGGMKEFAYGEKQPDGSHLRPDPSNWKYFGIASKTNAGIGSLLHAGNLLEKDIVLGPSLTWMTDVDGHVGKGAGGNPLKIAQVCADPFGPGPEREVAAEDIQTWRELAARLDTLDPEKLQQFGSIETLRTIDPRSPLFALGLFAIIESIITHDAHDQFDSLTHQVSTKMVLLSKRFERPLPYDGFQCSPSKLWKKLYEYRSCVAHGSKPVFVEGPLAALISAERAHSFLWKAAKLLLLQLLTEAELISDLKDC